MSMGKTPVFTGVDEVLVHSPQAEKADSAITCVLKGVESLMTTLQSLGPNLRQEGSTDRDCRSATRLPDAKAKKRAVLSERDRR